ncbi:MAG TPA: hypothetical protein VEF04_06465, partial [Blastocatellia bacterium]|nr:hypothetical protein [Blastocatellia bacterium]
EGNVKIGGNTDISEEKLGVPIYKPSDKASGQNLSVSGESPEGKGTFTIATFTTESSVEEVQSFYREKLGDKLRITETHGGENKVHMVLENEEGLRTIEISEDEASGKTKFVITSALGTKSKGGRNKMPPPANPLPPESIPLPPPPQGPPPPPR